MVELFKESPLLLLFVVAAIGYLVGSIRIFGNKMGVAAVLFVGLAFGALDPGLTVHEIVVQLGLVIFIYTIGLSSGPGFFAIFEEQGIKNALFGIIMLSISALITVGMYFLLDLDAATTGGLFAGSSTNTPALAGLIDLIEKSPDKTLSKSFVDNAVIGYSLSYPMGVIGTILAMALFQKIFKIDYRKEEKELQESYPVNAELERAAIRITNKDIINLEVRNIYQKANINKRVVFGRLDRGEETSIINWDTTFKLNDEIIVLGTKKAVSESVELLGERITLNAYYDRRVYDISKMFVSNPNIVGHTIASLNLSEKFPVLIARVNRGDMEILANGNTVLEFGDRVVLLARRKDMPRLGRIFGNSFEALSHVNLLSFGLGITMGLLLGMVTFSLPGGLNFKLGAAGGALIVSLLLSKWRRTGAMVWTLPHSANLTLRQFGVILLLAGIGIRSGHTFLTTLMTGSGGTLFLAGAAISTITAFTSLFIGYKIFKIPFSFVLGMTASQPAILEYGIEQSKNKLPTIGYTLMLPIALITKIVVVQLLYMLLK